LESKFDSKLSENTVAQQISQAAIFSVDFVARVKLLALEMSGKARRQRKVKIIVFGEEDFLVRVLHERAGGKYPTFRFTAELVFRDTIPAISFQ
jgi:hypothetical protein